MFRGSNHPGDFGSRFVKYLLLLFLLTNSSTLHAQNENTFNKVSIEIDGEDVFDVTAIVQDHQGYIWMATNLGLIKYNGLEGKEYYKESSNSSSVDYNNIESLFVDSQGNIWVGARSGLSKYNPECDCFHLFPTIDYNTSLTDIKSIVEDNNSNIWIGTGNGGIFQYERESEIFTRKLHSPSDSISIINDKIEKLLVDRNNNLWIGTNSDYSIANSGLVRYNIRTGISKRFLHEPSNPSSLTDNRISALYEDQKGQILIGTYKCGFHIYDAKSETINRISNDAEYPGLLHAPYTEDKVFGKDPYVRLIHQDQNGGYWIGTTGKGINYFNARTNTFKYYSFNLTNPQILWSIYEDRQGNVWIGGLMGGGLFSSDIYSRKYKLHADFTNVEAAYESPFNPGILWVKSRESGLSKMNLETNKIKRYHHNQSDSNSIGHDWTRSTYQENKKILWVGLGNGGASGGQTGDGGIDRMDIETELFTHFKLTRNDDGLGDYSYTVYSICEDHEGYLWLGTGPGGIFRSDRDKKEFKHFNIPKNDPTSKRVFLNIVRRDSNGDIWASDFEGSGIIYLFNRQEGKFKPYLRGFKATDIKLDNKGWLVISTWEKGLVHLNPNDRKYIQYTKKEGLPSNDALDIVEGEEGIFWVGTRMGPANFDTENGKISTAGLPKGRYNTGIFKASDGQIYVGKNNGLISFFPHQVTGNPIPPQINISGLLISDENHLDENQDSTELVFSHKQNDITFKYVGLHFSNPEKNSYLYKLDPLDDKWINAGSERTVRFANLSPGSYNFQVKASNSDGVWSEKSESILFTIKQAWWRTWLAYIIYLALAIAFADRFYRFQLSRKMSASESKRLKEINQLKNSMFTNITHEFRTPLTVIKGMTGAIKSNLDKKQFDDFDSSLEMIQRNSDGLLHLVNEMLDLAKIESGNMKLQLIQADVIPFLKYLSESFSSLAEENRISLTIYPEIDTLTMDFDANKLTSVISNLLSNAIKYTSESGKIIFHINQITHNENPCLFVKIKDNGLGISNEELPHNFNRFYQTDASSIRKSEGTGIGLALAKELVELMKGSIEVKSTINIGSEFSLMIPITRNAPESKSLQLDMETHSFLSNTTSIGAKQTPEADSELPLVLIIEDNMDVAHYLKTCLINKYETIHAPDGIAGIEMALEKIPDIIISDVMMPGKDGFEVCEILKSDERSDHIPIIILTAKATEGDRLKGLSHGADAYLAKPFNEEELFTRLNQLVSQRKKLIHKIQKSGFNALLKTNAEDPKLQFLHKAEKLIHADISNSNFGSSDLARELLISESQLYRKIKAITDKSTAVFIRSTRLQYAKELLLNKDKTVSEVAYEVGFNDPSWFSRAFKDEFGFTPSESTK